MTSDAGGQSQAVGHQPNGNGHKGVRGRLFGSLLAAAVLTILAGAIGLDAFRGMRHTLNDITSTHLPTRVAAYELARQAEAVVAAVPSVAGAPNHAVRETAHHRVRDQAARLGELLGQLSAAPGVDQGLVDIISAEKAALDQTGEMITELARERIDLGLRQEVVLADLTELRDRLSQQVSEPATRVLLRDADEAVDLMFIASADPYPHGLADLRARAEGALQRAYRQAQGLPQSGRVIALLQSVENLGLGPDGLLELRRRDHDIGARIDGLLARHAHLSSRLVMTTQELVLAARAGMDRAAADARSTIDSHSHILVALALLCVAGMGVVMFYVSRRITSRLVALSGAMIEGAGGKPVSIELDGDDEITEMGRALTVFIETRDRAEAALRESEQRFRDVVDASSEWIWEMDADLRFSFVSEGRSQIGAMPVRAMLGAGTADLKDRFGLQADDWSHYQADFLARRAFRGFAYRIPDGTDGWTHIKLSGKPIFAADGAFRGYRGTGIDITAEVEAEERARSAQRRLTDAIENIPEGFVIWDDEGRAILANSRYHSLFPSAARPPARAGAGETVEVEHTGRWLQIREHAMNDGSAVGIYSDITELKLRERALVNSEARAAEANARLLDAIESIPEGFILLDAQERLVLCNSKAIGDLGAITTLAPGTRYADILRDVAAAHWFDDTPERAADWVAEKLNDLRSQTSYEARTRDGRWVAVHHSATGEGGYTVVRHDITELRARQEELSEAKEIAETANQAKTRFLAAASHDLRQPLQALGLFTATLAGKPLAPDAQMIVGKIEASLEALEGLLDALLDISKLDAGIIEPQVSAVSLGSLFDRLAAEFVPLAASRKISLSFRPTRAAVLTDPALLERVLRNLISNALRYTEQGRVLVACRPHGHGLALEVWDTGRGIPPDQLKEIFREFHQLENPQRDRRKGLGLGLAIVERTCALLHHEIDVKSTLGRGSLFRVLLPAAMPRPVPTAARPEPPRAAADMSGRFVIVIDDEPEVCDGLRGLLESWGLEVATADAASTALVELSRVGRTPDAIVADYRLRNRRTGAGAIARIRAQLEWGIPGILITGDTAPERLRQAREHGFPLLHKPVRPDRLRAALEDAFAEGAARRQALVPAEF